MAGNSFGKLFKISTFGESHGPAIGVIIDGCPSGLEIDLSYIQQELSRRKPGQSNIVTQRKEADEVEILSGVFEGLSTGTPISLLIRNKDQKSRDYDHIKDKFRPSHADFTYDHKYGQRDYRGGGRSSARETAARVASGAIAKLLLKKLDVNIQAYVSQVGTIKVDPTSSNFNLNSVEENIVRAPDQAVAEEMIELIKATRKKGDTIGGMISCLVSNVPPGVGDPVFDKLHADLGKAMLSINAVKGFEYGSGFACIEMNGSQHNDEFVLENEKMTTKTNHSGGIQGGISNGMPINFNVAFKPVATLMIDQQSVDRNQEATMVKGKGRHDPCVVPRAVVIVEAMTALVLADHVLRMQVDRIDQVIGDQSA